LPLAQDFRKRQSEPAFNTRISVLLDLAGKVFVAEAASAATAGDLG